MRLENEGIAYQKDSVNPRSQKGKYQFFVEEENIENALKELLNEKLLDETSEQETVELEQINSGAKKQGLMEIDTFDEEEKNKIISEIANEIIEENEKKALVKIRINQSVYRKKLLKRYNKCCLCPVKNKDLLVASHIKPWAVSDSNEKLDDNNGLLLCPNHDKLFDVGWITFNDTGKIIISEQLEKNDRLYMNVTEDMSIEITKNNAEYIKYHREYVFIDNKSLTETS